MIEVIFLIVLATIWLVFAVVQDVKKTEISNWLNFSLIIFALGFRFFYSLFVNAGFEFFYQGLVGLGIFFVLGNLLYYGKMFAGGDAKLMIALGAVLPFSTEFFVNMQIFIVFFFLFLLTGAVYGLAVSTYFAVRNFGRFRKEFVKQFNKHKAVNIILIGLGSILILFGAINGLQILYPGILIIGFYLLYLYAKSIDEACMVWKVKAKKLREGDWLYNDVRVGKKTIKANWDGLSKKNIALLKKRGKDVVIRHGIAYAPVFLISFLILVYLYLTNGEFLSLFIKLF